MSNAPENPRDDSTTPPAVPESMPVFSSVNKGVAQQPPFSKLVIWGFIVSLISLIVFGMLGALGAVLARHGLRSVKAGTARGRGPAIAAIVMGSVAVAFYLFNAIANNLL